MTQQEDLLLWIMTMRTRLGEIQSQLTEAERALVETRERATRLRDSLVESCEVLRSMSKLYAAKFVDTSAADREAVTLEAFFGDGGSC